VNAHTDWESSNIKVNYEKMSRNNHFQRDSNKDVPDTCCVLRLHNCGKYYIYNSNSYYTGYQINTNGCYENYIKIFKRNIRLLYVTASVTSIILIILIVAQLLIAYMKPKIYKSVNQTDYNLRVAFNDADDVVYIN
jgi:hypothetical protein